MNNITNNDIASSFEIFRTRNKELREEYGVTQKDFSELIGITRQTLSGYENGRAIPSLYAIATIAIKCSTSID